ncbi:hypothetical protein NEUTE1DRAFT_28247, partial [Neurospora tetrasperma FGSC 2508]
WVMSLDTDYIYLEEPDWSEQSGAWETTYIHVHNKAVPDQKVWQSAAEAKKEKQKGIIVDSEKSRVVKKVNNKKDLRKREKQLTQSMQVTTIVSKAVDTSK